MRSRLKKRGLVVLAPLDKATRSFLQGGHVKRPKPLLNRVAGGIAPPGSHTTGHAGPRPAVPDRPEGHRRTVSLPRWL